MKYHTIDHNFDYRVRDLLSDLYPEYEADKIDGYTKSFIDWLWDNADKLGKALHEDIEQFCAWEGVLPDGVPNPNDM